MGNADLIERHLDQVIEEIRRMEGELLRTKGTRDLAKREASTLTGLIAQKERAVTQKEDEIKRLEEEITRNEHKKNEHEAGHEKIKTDIGRLEHSSEKIRFEREIEVKEKEIKKFEEAIAQCRVEIGHARAGLAKIETDKKSLLDKSSTLERSDVKSTIDRTVSTIRQKIGLETSILSKLKAEIKESELALSNNDKNSKPANDAITFLEREIDLKKKEKDRLQSELDSARRQGGLKTRF